MPLVRARYIRGFVGPQIIPVDNLREACKEIVPAAFNSKKGRLTPGSIEFIADPTGPHDRLTADVLLEIEAFHFDDREDMDDRCENIKAALKKIFPDFTFAVWGKLVKAGWASDSSDPEFEGDMSMEAAIKRARATVGA